MKMCRLVSCKTTKSIITSLSDHSNSTVVGSNHLNAGFISQLNNSYSIISTNQWSSSQLYSSL